MVLYLWSRGRVGCHADYPIPELNFEVTEFSGLESPINPSCNVASPEHLAGV